MTKQTKTPAALGRAAGVFKNNASKASLPVTAQERSLDHDRRRTSGSGAPGDGRALRQPTPSATWQPRTQRTLRARPRGFKAHGFASPLFSGFALSRMKGVAIQARRVCLPPKPPQNLATSLLATTLERESTPGKSLKRRFLEKPVGRNRASRGRQIAPFPVHGAGNPLFLCIIDHPLPPLKEFVP